MGGFDEKIIFYGDDTDIVQRAKKFGKTLFYLHLFMPTSGRRFQKE
jgi:GT2 family glycosyltransferase